MERVDPDSGIDLIDGLIVAVTELDSELDSSDRDIYFFVFNSLVKIWNCLGY